jgi:hypothetical protein
VPLEPVAGKLAVVAKLAIPVGSAATTPALLR